MWGSLAQLGRGVPLQTQQDFCKEARKTNCRSFEGCLPSCTETCTALPFCSGLSRTCLELLSLRPGPLKNISLKAGTYCGGGRASEGCKNPKSLMLPHYCRTGLSRPGGFRNFLLLSLHENKDCRIESPGTVLAGDAAGCSPIKGSALRRSAGSVVSRCRKLIRCWARHILRALHACSLGGEVLNMRIRVTYPKP